MHCGDEQQIAGLTTKHGKHVRSPLPAGIGSPNDVE